MKRTDFYLTWWHSLDKEIKEYILANSKFAGRTPDSLSLEEMDELESDEIITSIAMIAWYKLDYNQRLKYKNEINDPIIKNRALSALTTSNIITIWRRFQL